MRIKISFDHQLHMLLFLPNIWVLNSYEDHVFTYIIYIMIYVYIFVPTNINFKCFTKYNGLVIIAIFHFNLVILRKLLGDTLAQIFCREYPNFHFYFSFNFDPFDRGFHLQNKFNSGFYFDARPGMYKIAVFRNLVGDRELEIHQVQF